MRLENVRLHQQQGLFDIEIDNGLFMAITPAGTSHSEGLEVLECNGQLALPPFIDPHVHLDTALTAGEPVWNRSGTLFEGIQNWSERKKTLTREDVKNRAAKALEWYIAQGVQHVRSHVDTTDPSLTALHALLELREEMRDLIDIHCDEIDDDQSRFVETVATLALERSMGHRERPAIPRQCLPTIMLTPSN